MSDSKWGGARRGAGRPQTVVKKILFNATRESLSAIASHVERTGATQTEALRYACGLLAKHESRKAK